MYSNCIQLRKYDNLLSIFGRQSITLLRAEVCDIRCEGKVCNGPTRNGQAACIVDNHYLIVGQIDDLFHHNGLDCRPRYEIL